MTQIRKPEILCECVGEPIRTICDCIFNKKKRKLPETSIEKKIRFTLMPKYPPSFLTHNTEIKLFTTNCTLCTVSSTETMYLLNFSKTWYD
jgi:hypothetical protein